MTEIINHKMTEVSASNASARSFENDRYNTRLSNAFLGIAFAGAAIAVLNTPIHFIQKYDAVNWIENSYALRYFANHIKGMGQAILFSQVAGLGVSSLLVNLENNKNLKETGKGFQTRMKDFTVPAVLSCLLGGYAWEKITQGPKGFDTVDMAWYFVGAGVLITANKIAKSIIQKSSSPPTTISPEI